MQSDGGLCAPEVARTFPIRLLESGPAGGALATVLFAREAGLPDAIAFDMGGTTAKSCLIENGRAAVVPMMETARVRRFRRGSGLPIKAPVVDMIEIGAGGGSIAGLDETGLLKVGPRSAGAAPGPACYGQGGEEATVTDANLLLGYYDPSFFLGGSMTLDKPAAEAALARLGATLGLPAIETAAGIHAVVCEAMAGAARVHLIEKGRDPRRYAMVAFGGAGPGACRAGRARAGHRAGADSAGLRCGLGARLPRRAARLRAVAQRADLARQGHGLGAGQCESCPARSVGAQPPARGRRRRLHGQGRALRRDAPRRPAPPDHGAPAGRCARGREPAGADRGLRRDLSHALHARRR